MASFVRSPLHPLLAKLDQIGSLTEADRAAVLGWPASPLTIRPRSELFGEGRRLASCAVLLDGIAARTKLSSDGRRQIVSFHFPGDLLGLQGIFFPVADHGMEAVTRLTIVEVQHAVVIDSIDASPALARVLWQDTLIDSSIIQEWVMNIGRRDARSRIAHLLCEFGIRAERARLGRVNSFSFPVTQEQLADATGLTPIHVNRTLGALRGERLIEQASRRISVPDVRQLRSVADFNSAYLHRLAEPMPGHQI